LALRKLVDMAMANTVEPGKSRHRKRCGGCYKLKLEVMVILVANYIGSPARALMEVEL